MLSYLKQIFSQKNKSRMNNIDIAKVKAYFNVTSFKYLKSESVIQIRMAAIREMLAGVNKLKILDLGCGDGSLSLQFLPEVDLITLVDFSDNMLNICRNKVQDKWVNRVEFIVKDINSFVTQHKYDVVLCVGVLSHVESIYSVLNKIFECTKPGGYCIIQLSDSGKLLGRLLNSYVRFKNTIRASDGYDLRSMSLADILKITNSLGLCLKKERRYFIPPLLSRLVSEEQVKKYGLWMMNHRLLASVGPEVILMFKSN
jgi:2-polyprenyl-3-methyl-5-hydroxy-6-metoxy-1,4-benzoquinol methylase